MSEFEPPAPGWWKAADDNWYPPESHPDHTAPHASPSPPPPRPAGLAMAPAAAGRNDKPWWRKWWAMVGAAVLALLVIAGIAGSDDSEVADVTQTVARDSPSGEQADSGDQETEQDAPAAAESEPDRESENEAEAGQSADGETDDTGLSLGGAGQLGTREDPLAYDATVPVEFSVFGDADGSIWNMRITPPRDLTAEVMAENSFNDAPPEGVLFAGFDVEMTLASAGKEPLSPGFNFNWEILGGATSAVYESSTIDDIFGCGVSPNEFDRFSEVFLAGTLSGTVCIPLPAEDLNSPDTFVAMNFGGDRLVFATDGARPDPVEVAGGSEGPSGTALGYGAEVPVTFSTFGDADQSVWNVTVSPPLDIGAAILEANQLNDPPPDGVTFVGFEVQMTLASADKEPLSPGFNFTWEILGGATSAVYESGTIDGLFGCGVASDEFDDFAEVFVGGTVSGVVCIPVPTEDLGHPDTQVAMNFSGDRITFSEGGPTPPPAALTPGEGVAGVGSALAFGSTVDLTWDTLGDADGSAWSTTISNWRDITADVAAENPFNDPPPEGAIYVGFDVEMTLIQADKEPLSAGFNFSWEVLGAATNRVYGTDTIGEGFGCGVTPTDFDNFAEVFSGGTLSGTVCIPLTAADFADPGTRVAMNFSGDRITFAPSQ